MQPMVAKAVRAGGWASRTGERSTASWIRCLAVASLVLIAVAVILEISRMGRLIPAWPAETAAIAMLGLAGLLLRYRQFRHRHPKVAHQNNTKLY